MNPYQYTTTIKDLFSTDENYIIGILTQSNAFDSKRTEVTPLIIMQTFLIFACMVSSGTVNSIVAIIHLFILQSYTFSSMLARKANKSAIHVVKIFKCS